MNLMPLNQVAQKNLFAVQESVGLILAQGGPLEKGMARHSSILAWKIPWREEPGRLQSIALPLDTSEGLTVLL